MRTTKIHLMDLVQKHYATSAEWKYVEDPDHVTRGVMCWVVTLHDANIEPKRGWASVYRVKAHTIKLANGAELVTDEYIAHMVNKRLESAS